MFMFSSFYTGDLFGFAATCMLVYALIEVAEKIKKKYRKLSRDLTFDCIYFSFDCAFVSSVFLDALHRLYHYMCNKSEKSKPYVTIFLHLTMISWSKQCVIAMYTIPFKKGFDISLQTSFSISFHSFVFSVSLYSFFSVVHLAICLWLCGKQNEYK